MRERRHLAIALALTAVAVALRVPRVSEGIIGDELLTYNVVSHGGLGHVLRLVHETENNPPLYFILAWLCRQLGHSVAFPGHPMMRVATAPGRVAIILLFVVLALAAVRTWRRRPPEVRPCVPFFGALTVVTSSESRS